MRLVSRLHGRCLSSSESTSTSVAMTRAKAGFPSEVPVVFQGTPCPPDKPAVSCPGLDSYGMCRLPGPVQAPASQSTLPSHQPGVCLTQPTSRLTQLLSEFSPSSSHKRAMTPIGNISVFSQLGISCTELGFWYRWSAIAPRPSGPGFLPRSWR